MCNWLLCCFSHHPSHKLIQLRFCWDQLKFQLRHIHTSLITPNPSDIKYTVKHIPMLDLSVYSVKCVFSKKKIIALKILRLSSAQLLRSFPKKTFMAEFKGATLPSFSLLEVLKYMNAWALFDDNNVHISFNFFLWICLFCLFVLFWLFPFHKNNPSKKWLWMQVRRTQDWHNSIF